MSKVNQEKYEATLSELRRMYEAADAARVKCDRMVSYTFPCPLCGGFGGEHDEPCQSLFYAPRLETSV